MVDDLQQKEPSYFSDADSVDAMNEVFSQVNMHVQEVLQQFRSKWNEVITVDIRKQSISLTPARVFTHVITHEFHHKGQILMLARNMGYTPPDTDIIRF
jgi:uncharacterized damage-inducible protein DinB